MSSDLDITCCHVGQPPRSDIQQVAALTLGQWIAPALRQHSSFQVVEEVLGARIPILKLCFEGALDVDLSCLNPKPLLNTRLLKAYSQLDVGIKELGLVVKLWAKGAKVCDATKSNLSSYAFTLLVIYFLQVHPDIQLPVLPVEAFDDSDGVSDYERVIAATCNWQWCGMSLFDLLVQFFHFYGGSGPDAFQWGSEVVSVRFGTRRTVQDHSFRKLRGRQARRVHIEDPYELERNLHAPMGDIEEKQLRAAFSQAHYEISSKQVPSGLLQTLNQDSILSLDEKVVDFDRDLHSHKELVVVDPGSDSTASGSSIRHGASDDDSCSETFFRPDLAAIPMPRSLFKAPDSSRPQEEPALQPDVQHLPDDSLSNDKWIVLSL